MSATVIKKPDFKRIEGAASRVDAMTADAESRVDEGEVDHHRNAPRPNPACLYGLVGEIARAGSETTEANAYAVALNALAYLGCCVGRGPYLPVGNTYHHARLFTLHVGRSGRGRKGDAVSLIHRIDMQSRKTDPDLSPQVHRGGLSSREGLIFLIHDGYTSGKDEVEPIYDKRLWVVESEFANVLAQTKRDGNTLSAALRDGWDGVSWKPATKSNRISATDPHLGLSGAVTPSELLSLIAARELSNGFANRFLTIFSERARMTPFPQATTQDTVDALAERIGKVLKFAGADRHVDRDQKRMSLSPAAAKVYSELYLGELNRHDYGPLVTGLLERRAPVLLRIAMIFALTDQTLAIDEKHIAAALAWVRYWVESVRFVFSSAAQEEVQREVSGAADQIVKFLAANGRQSRTAITTQCFHGKATRTKIDAALDELLQSNPPAVQVEIERRVDGPGSPTKFYVLTAKSANSANPEHPCGSAADLDVSEVSEVSELRSVSDAGPVTTVRSVRSVRQTENPAETRANADDSLSSLSSPANTNTEAF